MGSLSDKLEYLLDTKEQLKQALIDKNVDIDENTTFRNFAIKTTDNTNLVDTSDANATASDIADGKTAYVNGQKITGNVKDLNQNVPYSGLFQDTTVQYVKIGNSLKVRTRTNRNILVREWTPRLEIGVSGSSVVQEIGLSADKLKKDEVVLGITGTYEGEKAVLPDGIKFQQSTSTNMDWLADVDTSQITSFSGFIRMSKQITSLPYFDASNGTNFSQMCGSCSALVSFPQINTSNGTNFYNMFTNCKALVNVPVLDWSKATNLNDVFGGYTSAAQPACDNLSNESLNNILEMCANATAYIQQGTNMTLKYIGLTSAQATTCQTLSNWDAFVAAGWTTGY